jgi:hypothetical protein
MATAKERHEKIPKAVKYGTVATAIMMGVIAILTDVIAPDVQQLSPALNVITTYGVYIVAVIALGCSILVYYYQAEEQGVAAANRPSSLIRVNPDTVKVSEEDSSWWHRFFSRTTPSNAVDPEAEIPSFETIIRDAELLLSYAATAGITLNDTDVNILTDTIQKYKAVRKTSIEDSPHYADFLLSYSRIAKALLPITALTIRQCSLGARSTIHFYTRWGLVFVVLVVSASLITFVSSAISDSIKTEIDLANSKAITLRAHLGDSTQISTASSPTYSEQDKLIDLQQLASSSRSIYGRAIQLHHLIFFSGIPDPFADIRSDNEKMRKLFELDPALANPYNDFLQIVGTYQPVRAYAQSLREFVAFWYGGIAASILPVCYALLGVSAWTLRQMQITIQARTFAGGARSGRMLVAAIAGTVIGLFSGLFVSSGVSLSPLAWAFLAGYSSDTLFQLLDGGLRTRTRTESNAPTVPAQTAGA